MTGSKFDKQMNKRGGRITMLLHGEAFHNKDKIQRAKIGLQLFSKYLNHYFYYSKCSSNDY